jgi:hypothetical protein
MHQQDAKDLTVFISALEGSQRSPVIKSILCDILLEQKGH